MTKILFICHGNICRSPMAEYFMKDIVRREGLEKRFEIASPNPASAAKGTLFLSRVRKLPLQESNGDAGGKIDVSYVQNKDVTFE